MKALNGILMSGPEYFYFPVMMMEVEAILLIL